MHGQVYGEYRSQRRKSYGQAFDGFAPGLGRHHSTSGVDGTEFIICLLFILSGFYRNIYIGTVSGTSVIFHVDGRGPMYSYVLFFPAVIFFSCILFARDMIFNFASCLRLPGVSWRSQSVVWVSGWRCRLHFILLLVDDLLLLYEIDS